MLLAQTVVDIYQSQQDAAVGVRKVIEALQEQLITSEIFLWSCQVAMFFGAVLIGFYSINLLKDFSKSKDPKGIFWGLIYIVVITALIFNTGKGANIGTLSLLFSKATNRLAEFPITLISKATGTSNIIAESAARTIAESIRDEGIKKCLELEAGNERDICLAEVVDSVQAAVEPYVVAGLTSSTIQIGPIKLRSWQEEVLTSTKEAIFPYLENKNIYTTNKFGEKAFAGAASILGIGLAGILFLVGAIFTYLVGITQTVMIIVVPLLCVLSYTALFRDSLLNWVRNFVLISLSRLVFNLLVAVAAWANLAPKSPDPILFPLIVAVMSSVFSIGLLRGAGPELIGAQNRLTAAVPATAGALRGLFKR